MSLEHYIGPSTSEILNVPLEDVETYNYSSILRDRSFQVNGSQVIGYFDETGSWNAVSNGASAPTQWYNSTKFCDDYLAYNNGADINANNETVFSEPNVPIGWGILNYALGFMGPFGLITGHRIYETNKTAGAILAVAGLGSTILAGYQLSNYTFRYFNSANYMDRLVAYKGMNQVSGGLMLGLGAGLIVDGICRYKDGNKGRGVVESIFGIVSALGGITSLFNSAQNWTSMSAVGNSAMYTLTVNPPAAAISSLAPALGFIGFGASILMGLISNIISIKYLINKFNKNPKPPGVI
ncbi:MAG: hypothetical protein JW791_04075 [Nanoarchaeota archaeon]|nr:hypothetical protein [Nanoarchaeota archaeon]